MIITSFHGTEAIYLCLRKVRNSRRPSLGPWDPVCAQHRAQAKLTCFQLLSDVLVGSGEVQV